MADAGPCRGEQQAAADGRITAIVRPVHDFPVRENRRVCWAVAFERESRLSSNCLLTLLGSEVMRREAVAGQ